MDFIRETILTFTQKDKEEFERFLARKQVRKQRKDILVFQHLFEEHMTGSISALNLKGDQNYHAIRKRLSKELSNYLVLKRTQAEDDSESNLLMIQHFIDLTRFKIAWKLLIKEELKAEKLNKINTTLKIQRLKISIMPYYGGEEFEVTKQKTLQLQKLQEKTDQFQMSFIQIQNELKHKMSKGDLNTSQETIDHVLNEYSLINGNELTPKIYLRIIEIIRSEYLIVRKFKAFAEVAQQYYDKIIQKFQVDKIDLEIRAQLEYIMAHAYFRVRNFKTSMIHIEALKQVMMQNEFIDVNFKSRYLSLKSSINVFEGHLEEAISVHANVLEIENSRLSVKEQLNLSLNLVAYYCCQESFSKANRILLFMNESDRFYQKHMGREWLIRKDLIRSLVQVELENVEIAINILVSVKKKHSDMFATEQYAMVFFYINTLVGYLNDPHQTTIENLTQMETQTNFKKDKLFDDPKLLSFYVWLKSKISNKNLYQLLLEEYELLR